MKPLLIVVSTCNRTDLTGLTLDGVFKNKTDMSQVLVLDDASDAYDEAWFKRRWGWRKDFSVARRHRRLGVGAAARERFKAFIESDHSFLITLDNDVQLSRLFDGKLVALLQYVSDDELTVCSGYRSCTQKVLEHLPGPGYSAVRVDTVGGLCQVVDRRAACRIIERMKDWPHNWDSLLSKIASKIVVPEHSLLQHLGIYGNGVNGYSSDVAMHFVDEK